MKIYNKYTAILAASLLMVGCDITKVPEGDTLTEEQKKDVIDINPEMLLADVNGLPAGLIPLDILKGTSLAHFDFGYPAVAMIYDASGQDIFGPNVGYNWFSDPMLFSDKLYTTKQTNLIWKLFYNHMKTANNILEIVDAGTDDATLKKYRGQALTSRAFDYLNLVQAFQFTYAGHENEKAVPLVLDNMPAEKISNNPRATVKEVYTQILKDLDEAIVLLEGVNNSGAKDQISQQVAYGLRARTNLVMQNWKEAAADAEKAMGSASVASLTDVSSPSFNSAASNSWIWGCIITEDNDVVQTGIINWPSHLCSFTGNGYTTAVGTWRSINNKLWNEIPATDIRKQWWVSPDTTTTLVDGVMIDTKEGPIPALDYFGIPPYGNVKFHAYKSIFGNTTNASDWPLMRAEEMVLIKAEGLAMSGDIAGSKSVLEGFVRTNRNPDFICTASSAEAIQDEIWFQRRIEFWGEGYSLFDVLRLKKPLKRMGTNFPAAALYDLPAESQIMIYRIPESEVNVNDGISESDNNPAATAPAP